jgi:RND family efflux transporter MFP subunit
MQFNLATDQSGNLSIARCEKEAGIPMRIVAKGLLTAGLAFSVLLPVTSAFAQTFTVTARQVTDEKAVFATVESVSVVPARARIGGTVALFDVREGDNVKRDQPIGAIGDEKLVLQLRALDAQIDALQAQSTQAQTDLSRIEGLVERGTLPRVRLEEARTAFNVAENGRRARVAERAVVQQQLTEGQVLAPADGRVLKKMAIVGSVVLPGDPIAQIAEQNFMLRLRIPERHAKSLKVGDSVRVDSAEIGAQGARTGRIELVYPQIEDGRVVADAKVEGVGEYFVGDRIRVWIPVDPRSAIVIPAGYVTTRFGVDYVNVQQANGTISVPVQRGRALPTAEMADGLEILSGLRPGDNLVRP